MISRSPAVFSPFLFFILLIDSIALSKKYIIRFPCLPYFWWYFVKTCCYSAIFVSILLSSSSVNCPCKMSSWQLIIFAVGLSMTLRKFSSRFLKCSFHFYNLSSWLAAFSFALKVFFFQLTSHCVCHANCDCLSSTEFGILLIWPWMYSCSFWYVSSLWAFFCFWALTFIGFLLLSKDAIFTSSCFFLTTSNSHGTLHLAFSLVSMPSADASIWAMTKFSFSSFGVCILDTPQEYQICFL